MRRKRRKRKPGCLFLYCLSCCSSRSALFWSVLVSSPPPFCFLAKNDHRVSVTISPYVVVDYGDSNIIVILFRRRNRRSWNYYYYFYWLSWSFNRRRRVLRGNRCLRGIDHFFQKSWVQLRAIYRRRRRRRRTDPKHGFDGGLGNTAGSLLLDPRGESNHWERHASTSRRGKQGGQLLKVRLSKPIVLYG